MKRFMKNDIKWENSFMGFFFTTLDDFIGVLGILNYCITSKKNKKSMHNGNYKNEKHLPTFSK